MIGRIYVGDIPTESTKCSDIDTSNFIRRLNDIDMSGKKIVNLGDADEEKDAFNLNKFNSEIASLEAKITTKIDTGISSAIPSLETRLRESIVTQNADIASKVNDKYNFKNQKLTYLLAGTEDTDAVNFKQLRIVKL